jgi:hypothetical protein
MKTKEIKELEKLDRKIMEEDYLNSYPRPTLGVMLLWGIGCLLFLAVFCIVVAGVSRLIFGLMQ